MKLVYFAWVRERIGVPEEVLSIPPTVVTVTDLLCWLREKGGGYEAALQFPEVIRVAIDHQHVEHGESLANAREIALFPPMTGG